MADLYSDIYSDIYGTVVSPAGSAFPQAPLAMLVELDVGGTWTDITDYVYSRDSVKITRGQPDESTAPQPSTCALTLNNRDGRFTLRNPLGAYYGQIGRNSQLRVSVQSAAAAGSPLAYRSWGEVSEWPPLWDPTGSDVYCQVVASGVLRRLGVSAVLGSALYRYWTTQSGALAPVAYWSCEDLPGATSLASAAGGTPMMISGKPALASSTAADCSAALPLLSNSTWTGAISATGLTRAYLTLRTVVYKSGSGSFVPPPLVREVTPQLWAPGAGGGGSSTDTWGGGGGGGYVTRKGYPCTPGVAIPWAVGTTGIAGTAGNGTAAGNVTFGTLTAYGGKGGTSLDGGLGGGGVAPGGIVHPGGKGGAPGASGGGGGSSGAPNSPGQAGKPGGTAGGAGGKIAGAGTGGTGGTWTAPKQLITMYYDSTHSYAFQGSDGTSPNARINIDGAAYQGGSHAVAPGYGHAKTFIMFNYPQIAADLSGGAVIKSVKVLLVNQTSYNAAGVVISLGWDTGTHTGTTNTDPTLHNSLAEFFAGQGATTVTDVTAYGFGTAFQSGGATCLKLYRGNNNLDYQGMFAGGTGVQLQITFTR